MKPGMRQFVWYCPQFDAIVFQWVMDDCFMSFEWSGQDLYETQKYKAEDPTNYVLLSILGEL